MTEPHGKRRPAQRDFLSRCALFSSLRAEQLDELAASGRILELPAHAVLHRPGEPLRQAFVLCSGSVLRYRLLAGEVRKVIELAQRPQLLAPGEVFGARVHGSVCEVVAPAIVTVLDVRVLRRMVREDLAFSARVVETLAHSLHAVEFDVAGHHAGLTGAQRILDYLVELAGGALPLAGETTVELGAKKKIVAERIGMTPEAFSRSLRELADKGLIVVERNRIHIQNAALLDTNAGAASEPRRLSFARKLRGRQEDELSPGERINLAGRLRVLSQRLAIAWALAAHGIGATDARAQLRQLTVELERVLARLQAIRMGAEPAALLAAVGRSWPQYRAALFAEEAPAAARVLETSEDFLAAADALTAYAERMGGLQSAHHVNVAGRNRMLSQRIVKLFLFEDLATGGDGAGLIERSVVEFEANLAELLRDGRALPEVAAQLEEIAQQWRRLLGALAPSMDRPRRSQQVRLVLAEGKRLLRCVDTAVKLYERLTREA
ncbi:MAG: type IV pili methyl-accepting chemotaxis transducer N-terminal domain-containing protein [Thauera sp.]|nr:type IV pili methyl-accepting chemotaxis transducer N-terminal domain-containing protein [Thauera sp.]